jgi:HD-GYP domain-containing protein (c-di-GMP phosphodiesterase class II)
LSPQYYPWSNIINTEQSFDPSVADIYIDHLAAVSKNNEAIAQEDIYNQFGILLLAKGMSISKKTASLLSNHKLSKPIDEVVHLSRPLKNQDLQSEFNQLFAKHEDFKKIHKSNDAEALLRHLCVLKSFHPTLLQKLTVLKERFPQAYERTLFGAWFSGIVARELGWSKDDIYNVFVSSLFQDLGLLHIPEDVVMMEGGFTPEQWRSMQSHVVISSIIVGNLECFPESIITAILEHHERFDGAGYPSSKNADSLGDLGQLTGMSDLLFRIRARSAAFNKEQSLSSVLAYLKVNSKSSRQASHEAAIIVLKRSKLSSLQQYEDAAYLQMADLVISRSQAIKDIFESIQKVLFIFSDITLGKQGHSIQILATKAVYVYKAAGFYHDEFYKILETFSHEELEDADRTQIEFLWVIKRIQQCAPQFIELELSESEDHYKALAELLTGISSNLNTLQIEIFSSEKTE